MWDAMGAMDGLTSDVEFSPTALIPTRFGEGMSNRCRRYRQTAVGRAAILDAGASGQNGLEKGSLSGSAFFENWICFNHHVCL
jgi:hypothetical protein